MKWLTKKEIARRARKSYKEALLVSIEHHQQIAQSTRKEFFAAVGLGKVSISSDHCGLCRRNTSSSCGNCFLRDSSYHDGCNYRWQEIRNAIRKISEQNGFWPAVVKAEKNMIKVLKKELKKQ